MSLGEIIRQRREQLGLTQDQLSEQAGISKPYLSNVETHKAKNPPTDRVLMRLERAMDFRRGELTRLAHLVRTPVDVRQEHEMLQTQVHRLRSILKQMMSGKKSSRPGLHAPGGAQQPAAPLEGDNMTDISLAASVPVINKVNAGYPQHFTDLEYPPSVADEYVRCPDIHDSQAFAARVVGDSMHPDFREGDIVVFSPNTPARSGDDCFVRFKDTSTTFKRFYADDERAIRLQPLNSMYPAETYDREELTGLWPAIMKVQRLR